MRPRCSSDCGSRSRARPMWDPALLPPNCSATGSSSTGPRAESPRHGTGARTGGPGSRWAGPSATNWNAPTMAGASTATAGAGSCPRSPALTPPRSWKPFPSIPASGSPGYRFVSHSWSRRTSSKWPTRPMPGRSVTVIRSMSAAACAASPRISATRVTSRSCTRRHSGTCRRSSPAIPCAGMAGGWPGNSCCGTRTNGRWTAALTRARNTASAAPTPTRWTQAWPRRSSSTTGSARAACPTSTPSTRAAVSESCAR